MILVILSAAIIIGILLYASWKNKGLPECLSDCYYIIGLPFTFIFFAASWAVLIPAMEHWASPVTVGMVFALSLVGVAADYKYKAYCGYDVVAKPELISKPVGAVRSSMWYWKTNSLNYYADRKEFIKITKRINGGTNGLQQRQRYYDKALAALT